VPAAHVHSLAFQIVIKIVMLMEGAGEHHATTEILVVGEDQFVIEVSDDRIGEIRLNPFDQVPVVDRALHPVLSERHEHDRPDPTFSLFIPRDDDWVGLWSQSGFETAVRREPDLELPLLRVGRRRNNRGSLHVPGVIAADHLYLSLLPFERICNRGSIASTCRSTLAGSLRQGVVHLRGPAVVVNGSRVAGQRFAGQSIAGE